MFPLYKKPLPSMKDLVKRSLSTSMYRPYWEKGVLVTAWHKLFPHMQQYLKDLSIKDQIAYVYLESLIWRQELRRNKEKVLIKLEETIKELTDEATLVNNIVFL